MAELVGFDGIVGIVEIGGVGWNRLDLTESLELLKLAELVGIGWIGGCGGLKPTLQPALHLQPTLHPLKEICRHSRAGGNPDLSAQKLIG
ncbi:hypothetical protein NEILACOT_05162 [Neisseria lactamica ATCC 23970]|uniref:Uncharacterized protein n=1 Tax=Neisseria lactamica ATCC 23970 TaxID=546265 RepID=D0WC82_NEILA|nr:hypothetical protein [Neisseria lactamica]EEZ74785.1 hypothetical protein NEILACOT_05162 [Neisseria lactamica ATCC 23970]